MLSVIKNVVNRNIRGSKLSGAALLINAAIKRFERTVGYFAARGDVR
jgi:hypothetical protein